MSALGIDASLGECILGKGGLSEGLPEFEEQMRLAMKTDGHALLSVWQDSADGAKTAICTFPSKSPGLAAKAGFYGEIGLTTGPVKTQADLDAELLIKYVETRLKKIPATSAEADVAKKGFGYAKAAAVSQLMKILPPQLHIAYSFSKQDAYLLKKVGLEYNTAASDSSPEECCRIEGNKVPRQVETRGTRLCVGGDKIVQTVAQAVTSALKKASNLPSKVTGPIGFAKLARRVRALDGCYLITRVDSLSFGMGIENSIFELV